MQQSAVDSTHLKIQCNRYCVYCRGGGIRDQSVHFSSIKCSTQYCSLCKTHILHSLDASQISQCNANIQVTAEDKKRCTTFQSAIVSLLIQIQIIYHDKVWVRRLQSFHNVCKDILLKNTTGWAPLKFLQTSTPLSSPLSWLSHNERLCPLQPLLTVKTLPTRSVISLLLCCTEKQIQRKFFLSTTKILVCLIFPRTGEENVSFNWKSCF